MHVPQLFKVGKYLVYFWSNENMPVEPIHVHISEGDPRPNASKVWITKGKRALICNNNSNIPKHELRLLLRIIEANSDEIIRQWVEHFKTISYYC